MKTEKYDYPAVGCYVDGGGRTVEELNLDIICIGEEHGFNCVLPKDSDEDYLQILAEIADEAIDFLSECEDRTGMYWNLENSDLLLTVDVDDAKQMLENDDGFISSSKQDYPDNGYGGEWLHVSDYGNAILYYRNPTDGKDTEIWAVV